MARARITINQAGIAEVLKSQGVQDDLSARMERVKAKAEASSDLPKGIEVSEVRTWVGHDRARSTVGIPGSIEAQHGILARALDAAKGE